MIDPEIAERFQGDPGVDIATYEIDAHFMDGEVRRVILRLGAPYQRPGQDEWLIRSELEHLDPTNGPLAGDSSFQALVIGIAWIVARLRIVQRRYQITYMWAGRKVEFEYEKVFSTTGAGTRDHY